MANYCCTSRTNYFRVTDENKYREIFGRLVSEDNINDFTETDKDGVVWHGFGSYGSIDYLVPGTGEEEDEYDINEFARQLQKILPEDEAFILFESGYEKLRYVTGSVFVVTRDKTKFLDIRTLAVKEARRMLGKKDWETKCEY